MDTSVRSFRQDFRRVHGVREAATRGRWGARGERARTKLYKAPRSISTRAVHQQRSAAAAAVEGDLRAVWSGRRVSDRAPGAGSRERGTFPGCANTLRRLAPSPEICMRRLGVILQGSGRGGATLWHRASEPCTAQRAKGPRAKPTRDAGGGGAESWDREAWNLGTASAGHAQLWAHTKVLAHPPSGMRIACAWQKWRATIRPPSPAPPGPWAGGAKCRA